MKNVLKLDNDFIEEMHKNDFTKEELRVKISQYNYMRKVCLELDSVEIFNPMDHVRFINA